MPVARLDELVRLVGESAAALLRIGRFLEQRLGDEPGVLDEYRDLARVLQELQERTMRARMVSVATVAGPLRRGVRDISHDTGKEVRWELLGGATVLDRHVLEQLREPLVALVRNAVDHGIEPPGGARRQGKPREGVVRVHAMQVGADVVISVADDGRGIDVERVRARSGRRLSDADALHAIFDPGLSTAETVTGVSGRGVGLDAVRTAVDALRGRIEVRSSPGRGTEFRISVPMTLAVLRCLLVRAGRHRYALPMHSTASAAEVNGSAISMEGRPALMVEGEAVGLAGLAQILELGRRARGRRPRGPAHHRAGRFAFRVDELLGQRDVVVKDVGRIVGRLELVAGASVEPDGSVMLVLDPDGLIARARRAPRSTLAAPAGGPATRRASAPPRRRILVVDDALTIRELQRSILERAGYEVATAGDGNEALRALAEVPADLVLTDVEMPGLDGFGLTEAIRAARAAPRRPCSSSPRAPTRPTAGAAWRRAPTATWSRARSTPARCSTPCATCSATRAGRGAGRPRAGRIEQPRSASCWSRTPPRSAPPCGTRWRRRATSRSWRRPSDADAAVRRGRAAAAAGRDHGPRHPGRRRPGARSRGSWPRRRRRSSSSRACSTPPGRRRPWPRSPPARSTRCPSPGAGPTTPRGSCAGRCAPSPRSPSWAAAAAAPRRRGAPAARGR